MGEQRDKKQSEEDILSEAEKQLDKMKEIEKKDKKDSTESKKADQPGQKKSNKKTKAAKSKKAKKRSAKYLEAVEKIDRSKQYNLKNAIELLKKTSYTKFDGSIELSARLLKKKSTQPFRTILDLPHGRGKKPKIVILDQVKIDQISKTKKIDFDIALVSPSLMGKVARIAKILGPKGKMPNPKSGTITSDPEKTKKELEGGKVEIKENDQGIIHQMVGKVSWDEKKLEENIRACTKLLPKSRLQRVVISATMSPGIKINLKEI